MLVPVPVFVLLLAALVGAKPAAVREDPPAASVADDPVLEPLQALLGAARAAREARDAAAARERIVTALTRAQVEIGARDDEPACALLADLGRFATANSAPDEAIPALERVLAVRAKSADPDARALQVARLDLADALARSGSVDRAEPLEAAALEVLERTLDPTDALLAKSRTNHAVTLRELGRSAEAIRLLERAIDVQEGLLAADAPELLKSRALFAQLCADVGDFVRAREIQEAVLAAREKSLPREHPDVLAARQNLGGTLLRTGDLARARDLFQEVHDVYQRTRPDDDLALASARMNLATVLKQYGEFETALKLLRKVVAVRERAYPADHGAVLDARMNLGLVLELLGHLGEARDLLSAVHAARARALPADHLQVQRAALNLASVLEELGDSGAALALEEEVFAVFTRTLPPDHPDLTAIRQNLGATLQHAGDLQRARPLVEAVVAVRDRTLPDDHPGRVEARANLAALLFELGDADAARVELERAIELASRALPDGHPTLSILRSTLAAILFDAGDLAGARALREAVLADRLERLPPGHPEVLDAQAGLATTILALGDLAGARELQAGVLAAREEASSPDDPELARARSNLGATLARLGELERAQALLQQALSTPERSRGEAEAHQPARASLAKTCARIALATETGGDAGRALRARAIELVQRSCDVAQDSAREALLAGAAREAEARCARLAPVLDTALSAAVGWGAFAPSVELARAAFRLSETTRASGLAAAASRDRAAADPGYAAARDALRIASAELAALTKRGADSARYRAAVERRDARERDLTRLTGRDAGGTLAPDADVLARALPDGAALVAFRRSVRGWFERDASAPGGVAERAEDTLWAFVLRRSGTDGASALVLHDLGPIAAIEDAVQRWRAAVGTGIERGLAEAAGDSDPVRARGVELRRLVFDPLRKDLESVRSLVIVADDVLHLVPLDALPADAAEALASGRMAELVGDRWHVTTRCTTAELLAPRPARGLDVGAGGALVALGGAAFNSEPLPAGAEDNAALEASAPMPLAGLARAATAPRKFAPLAYTAPEARGVAALYLESLGGDARAVVLDKRRASRAALEELAPRARWLHVATHGWYAADSIRAWGDAGPRDALTGIGLVRSSTEQVEGSSPMLLAGLALAGANLPEDEAGRVSGLVTAEEIATLDLRACELAVLSACDTNAGVRRAGQGVASLQRALQAGGARSVITSSWKVPDEATLELMLDFYRRLWIERRPKSEALWEAKRALRDARDEGGEPRYATRDWAGWVLTGEPD